MKKFVLALVLVMLMAMVTGCKTKETTKSGTESTVSGEKSGETQGQSAQSGVMPDSSSSEVNADANPYAGKFVSDAKDIKPENLPAIELKEDGTFKMTVNLLEGMGLIEGVWVETAGEFMMEVEKRDFSGFIGDDVDYFGFTSKDKNTLVYTGESIGMTDDGSIFIRK